MHQDAFFKYFNGESFSKELKQMSKARFYPTS